MKIGKIQLESYMTMKYEFDGIRVLDNNLYPVKWKLDIDLVALEYTKNNKPMSDKDIVESGSIAYQRNYFWLDTCLPGCIFVNTRHPTAMDIGMMCDNMIMHCPDDPTDDLIIMMIHSKLKAISAGKLHIGQIRLSSSDTSAQYTYNVGPEGYAMLPKKVKEYIDLPSLYRKPWWQRNDGYSFEFLKPKNCKDKLVDLYSSLRDPLSAFDESVSLEFVFEPEVTEPAEIIQVDRWQPKTV